jgi:hypothetical protein
MGNSHQDRVKEGLYTQTPSIWGALLQNRRLKNPFFQPGLDDVIYPNGSMRRLQVWHNLFSKWHPEFYSSGKETIPHEEHKEKSMTTAKLELLNLRVKLEETIEELSKAHARLAELTEFEVLD